MSDKLSFLDFITLYIQKKRNPARSRGIHSVYTNFNAAFRAYFPGDDPIRVVKDLVAQGKLETHFVRGGVMIYLPGEAPTRNLEDPGVKALRELGLSA